jgi:hypothetical protein
MRRVSVTNILQIFFTLDEVRQCCVDDIAHRWIIIWSASDDLTSLVKFALPFVT